MAGVPPAAGFSRTRTSNAAVVAGLHGHLHEERAFARLQRGGGFGDGGTAADFDRCAGAGREFLGRPLHLSRDPDGADRRRRRRAERRGVDDESLFRPDPSQPRQRGGRRLRRVRDPARPPRRVRH